MRFTFWCSIVQFAHFETWWRLNSKNRTEVSYMYTWKRGFSRHNAEYPAFVGYCINRWRFRNGWGKSKSNPGAVIWWNAVFKLWASICSCEISQNPHLELRKPWTGYKFELYYCYVWRWKDSNYELWSFNRKQNFSPRIWQHIKIYC